MHMCDNSQLSVNLTFFFFLVLIDMSESTLRKGSEHLFKVKKNEYLKY